MKNAVIAGIVISAISMYAAHANADSITDYVQAEVGAGYARMGNIGDGTWQQWGTPGDHVDMNAPAITVGLTGTAWSHGRWSLDWHADYVYLGTVTASCNCVADDEYNPHTHQLINRNAPTNYFDGQGHTQGVALTLAPGYSFGNHWRVALEAGGWAYWQTWHEYDNTPWGPDNASHVTHVQFSPVAGASIEYKSFALSYRHYFMSQQWNPSPAISTSANVLAVTYRHNLF